MVFWKNLCFALCGRAINAEALRKAVLKVALEYKGVEESLVDLTSMGKDDSLHSMVMERLGLSWDLYNRSAL